MFKRIGIRNVVLKYDPNYNSKKERGKTIEDICIALVHQKNSSGKSILIDVSPLVQAYQDIETHIEKGESP
jgi:hypothetical protein